MCACVRVLLLRHGKSKAQGHNSRKSITISRAWLKVKKTFLKRGNLGGLSRTAVIRATDKPATKRYLKARCRKVVGSTVEKVPPALTVIMADETPPKEESTKLLDFKDALAVLGVSPGLVEQTSAKLHSGNSC